MSTPLKVQKDTGEILTKSSLWPKLSRIMNQVSRIPKDGKFKAGNVSYDFVRESDLCDHIRPLLAAEGIGLLYSVNSVEWPTEKRCIVIVDITLGDETGETLHARAAGEAMDNFDKGLNKAQTAAVKYWLLKTFLVATGEGDEHEPPPDEAKAPPPRQRPRTAPPPQQEEFDPDAPMTPAQIEQLRVLSGSAGITDKAQDWIDLALEKGLEAQGDRMYPVTTERAAAVIKRLQEMVL